MIGRSALIAIAHPFRHAGRSALFAGAVFCALTAMRDAAPAQSGASTYRARSYVNPFPQTDRYHLHVFGDYLASGLASGLSEAFENDGAVKIINSSKSSAGLARPDRTDWAADVEELAKSQPIHIAVIMMGMNDVRNIRIGDGVARWGTDEWRDAYGGEVDKLIKALQAQKIAVYWVGNPIMAESKTSEAMARINDIVRERNYINGAKYIDTWSGFTDQLGGYAAYGPDLSGQNNRLRGRDGVSLTARGNRKLANYVEVILRRDLAGARSERNISLVGDEEEQARLVPRRYKEDWKAKTANSDAHAEKPGAEESQGQTPLPGAQPGDGAPADDQAPAKRGRKAPAGGLPQPALTAFASGYSPPGETIIGDISEGLTGLATVSPVSDLNVGERRLPVTERLYYRTLVKGEPLRPKPGRADDFRWPRS